MLSPKFFFPGTYAAGTWEAESFWSLLWGVKVRKFSICKKISSFSGFQFQFHQKNSTLLCLYWFAQRLCHFWYWIRSAVILLFEALRDSREIAETGETCPQQSSHRVMKIPSQFFLAEVTFAKKAASCCKSFWCSPT